MFNFFYSSKTRLIAIPLTLFFACSAQDKIISNRGGSSPNQGEGAGEAGKDPNSASNSSSPTQPSSSNKPSGPKCDGILKQEDFVYQGYYDVHQNLGNGELYYGQGFTHRYVGDELRFFTVGNRPAGSDGWLIEFVLPSQFGQMVTDAQVKQIYKNIFYQWQNDNGWVGLWSEPDSNRFWVNFAIDYPDDVSMYYTKGISTRTLMPDGNVSNLRGAFGLQGIGSRRLYGGATKIPGWFQAKYSVGPYAVGFGGYTSRLEQGFSASLGPTLYAIPDPDTLAMDFEIPTGQFKTLMDHGNPGPEWYAAGMPSVGDRGVRNSLVTNYYDGGVSGNNPSGRPTDPPLPTAKWLSPAPDGLGRWVWGDSAWNTGNWIQIGLKDNSCAKEGFLILPSFAAGFAWYAQSTLHNDSRNFEIQIFDPTDFGEVIEGKRPAWKVYPAHRWIVDLPGLGAADVGGNSPWGSVGGATFDPRTSKLYVYGMRANGLHSRIYVFNVN